MYGTHEGPLRSFVPIDPPSEEESDEEVPKVRRRLDDESYKNNLEFLRMNIIMFNTVIELSIMANPSFWSPSRIALKDVTAQSQYLLLLIVIVMPNNPIKNDLVIILTMIPEPQHFSLSLLCHCICWHKSWPALIGSHKADLSYSESYSSQEEDR